jgi:peptide/nickel transport system substrate-binding protein
MRARSEGDDMHRSGRATLAVGILGVALCAAGCGSAKSTGPSSSPSGPSGSLTIGSSVAPPGLDPTANAAAAIDEVMDYNVYQHLVQLDPKGAVVPVLASSDTVSTGGTTYTFTIRPGVRFSNGDPLTAADVVFSLKRAFDSQKAKTPYPYATLLADVKAIASPASGKVVVTLTHPDNQFLYNLAAYSNGVVLDPKAISTIATKPVGTGPYVYKSEVANYDVALTANPTYWGTKAKVATVTFRYFASSQAEDSALKSGAIQVIDNLSNTQDVSQFLGNSSYKVVHGPTNGKIQLTINNGKGPLANQKVRQAIAYATDKKAVLATAGDGYGTVIGSDNVPGDPWYLPSINGTYAYSVATAKKLMAGAGYAKGFPLTLTLPPYGYATTAGPLIQAELKAIGIDVTIKDVPFATWITQVFTAKDFQLTIIDHVEARDIGNYANCAYYWEYAGCKTVAGMLATATEATTTAKENAGFQAIIEKINVEAVNDWLYNPDQVSVVKSDVVGIPGSGLTESFDLSQVSLGGTLAASAAAEGYSS